MLDSPKDYDYWEKNSLGYHIRTGALSLILYDYFLTLDDEIELFWARPWTIATYLFLWTRYCGMIFLIITFILITNVSDLHTVRTAWYVVEESLGTINTCVIELILVLRLYALYNCSHRFAQAAKVAFGIQLLLMTAYGIYAMVVSLPFLGTNVLDGLIYCEILNLSAIGTAWMFWIPLLLFEAFILILTVRKAWYYHRLDGTSVRLTNLTSTLLWDSIAYSVVIQLIYIINITLDRIDGRNHDILTGLGFTLPIIMGGRMMLNVRRASSADPSRHVPSSPSEISLDFVAEPRPQPSVLKYI
ncbi:hypothetical protein AX14_002041 [Amanita brunnescens Koide BX004]|nr:hypothetical protein AX14_002041 [Amanita brunnescens Koide BX004]